MAINRYTQTSPVEFNLPIFSPNFELVAQAMGSQQSNYDQGLEDMNRQIQALSKDYGARDEIIQARQGKIDEIARVYQERGVTEGNRLLKQERRNVLKDHMTGGRAHAIENNFSLYGQYRDQIQKYKDAGNIRKAALLERSLNQYEGIGEGENGIYNSFSGTPIAKEVDSFTKADEYGKGWKADREITGRRKEDGFFITTSEEFIDPAQLKRDVFRALASDSEIMEDLSQEAMLMGLEGGEAQNYIDKKLNEAAQFSSDKHANSKEFEQTRVDWQARDRAKRNHDWSLKLYEEEKPYINPAFNGIEMVDGKHTMVSMSELENQSAGISNIISATRQSFATAHGVDIDALDSRLEGLSGVELNNALQDYNIPIQAYNQMRSFINHKEQELTIANKRRQSAEAFAKQEMGDELNVVNEFNEGLDQALVGREITLTNGRVLSKDEMASILSGNHSTLGMYADKIVSKEELQRYKALSARGGYVLPPEELATMPQDGYDFYTSQSKSKLDIVAKQQNLMDSYLENDSRGRSVAIQTRAYIPVSKDGEPNQKASRELTSQMNNLFLTNHADYLVRSAGEMFDSNGQAVSPEQIMDLMTNEDGKYSVTDSNTSFKYAQSPLGSTGRRMMEVTYSPPNGGTPLIVMRPVPTEMEQQIIHKGQRAKEYDQYGRPNVNAMRINNANQGLHETEVRIQQFRNAATDGVNFEMPTSENPNVKMYNYNPVTGEQSAFTDIFFTTGETLPNGELRVSSADGRSGQRELARHLYPDIINTQDNGETNN